MLYLQEFYENAICLSFLLRFSVVNFQQRPSYQERGLSLYRNTGTGASL